ncbi:hypothetical protein BV25DRAFT_1798171 [Artomyces pyxidatus]|uniref:Uncharacterized protein n=1 Tax=Artomyces pyxidatus TaxID=48021 RepID=A0ACB8TA91_9AGAM|nr:hypothetical protein BV25DRAFT_1798171 [Artomyces pyxidatus]
MSSSDGPSGPFEDYPVDRQSCQLLGPTALIVQGIMGVVVVASLLYKRHREKPKRPWRIWLFDVSKQIAGQMFVHGVNVLISDVGSARSAGNACVVYFLNILLDTTFGVGVIYLILHLLTNLFTEKLQLKGFESGQYGSPPSFVYWLRQAAVYVVALTSMKLLVVALFAAWPGIFKVGAWLLSWLGTKDAVQVIFTMGLFPIFMNVLQFWLIDSIVKASAGVALPSDSPRASLEAEAREPLFQASEPSDDDDFDTGAVLPDIEAQRRSRSLSSDLKMHRRSNSLDRKDIPSASASSSGSGSRGPAPESEHAYPPSVPGSPTPSSRPTSTSPVPRNSLPAQGLGLRKHRRSPPPPLLPRSPMVPALNSPDPVSGKAAVDAASKDNWDAWDGEEDWADRVGEEEWTGRRLEAKKGEVDGVWKNS